MKFKGGKMTYVGPVWWHCHGHKLTEVVYHPDDRLVRLDTNAVRVTLVFIPGLGFELRWVIRTGPDEIYGKILLSHDLLATALDVRTTRDAEAEYRDPHHPALYACAGKFVRQGRHLNVPCKGTAQDGDPNVSIYIGEELNRVAKDILTCQCASCGYRYVGPRCPRCRTVNSEWLAGVI